MAKLRFLLDTNILSELIRQPDGVIAQRIAEEGEDTICTSIIVACELRYGALKKGAQALSERVEALLGVIEVLALEEDADSHYAAIRCELSRNGHPVGPNDLLIAAHARALNLTIVTANEREFSRVPSLQVENWLRE